MKLTKQTVYLPVNGEWVEDKPTLMSCDGDSVCNLYQNIGYFFTPEQLNQFISNVIKDTLDTAAENADSFIDMNEDAYVEGNVWSEVDKESITDTFEETFKLYQV